MLPIHNTWLSCNENAGTFGTNMLQNVQLTIVAFLRDLACLWNTIERYGSGGTSNMVLYSLHPISGL